jgi:hypothetical protein
MVGEMSKVEQLIQGNMEYHIFRCYCGECSYLSIIQDSEDDQIYIEITLHPTRLTERLKLAWKALRGLEFLASNEVIIDGSDAEKLIEAVRLHKSSMGSGEPQIRKRASS